MRRTLVMAIAMASLSGCSSGSTSRVGTDRPSLSPNGTSDAPAFRPVADVRQTMLWILDPAADVIWDSAGAIITAEGETDLSPTTDAGWQNVRNNAAVVAETGNLLMMPGRGTGGPKWAIYAQALTAAGEVAMAAADAQDADALFDAGGEIYQVCRACHAEYMVPTEEMRTTP
jgi:hypothetical protein